MSAPTSSTPHPSTKHSGVVVEREQSSGLNVLLHPLVIIEISDHYTRAKVNTQHQVGNAPTRVIGALLGIQSGRKVEIMKSFELVLTVAGIDDDYLKTKQDQMKKVFPNYEFRMVFYRSRTNFSRFGAP